MSKKVISFILSIVMMLLIIQPAAYAAQAADYETELIKKGFPESYIPALLELHEKYPNWSFEVLEVGENFTSAINNERQPHKQQLIQIYSGNDGYGYYCTCSSCYVNGSYVIREGSNWVAASESAVAYYLDPRNFLDEEHIFQFESTAYNAGHTQEGVEYILSGTWMYNSNITYKDKNGKEVTYKDANGNTVKYSKAIMEAAKGSNLSAYYIASKIVQEVGGASPTAGGASGTYSGYPGIYNYYNIMATGGAGDGIRWASVSPDSWVTKSGVNLRKGPSTSTEAQVVLPANTTVNYISTTARQSDGYTWVNVSVTYNGKSYTGYIRSDYVDHKTGTDQYNRPWTNPYLSIINGAQWISNNFATQFTGYLQKFNVNPASGTKKHSHEYMANVQAAASEAKKAYTAYKKANMLDAPTVFTIPVYYNMPVGELAAPRDISVSATVTGVKINWSKVSGAEKYRVFYKTGSGGWTKIDDTTSTNYTWTGAKSGTNYTFTVRCISNDGNTYMSDYNSVGASITYIAAPKLSSVSNTATGVQINWEKVTGAEKYRIFYKTDSGSWTKIADTTSLSYTWKGAKSNTKYTFTVRCVSADGKAYTSSFDSDGLGITAAAKPEVSAVSLTDKGVKISWGKFQDAANYRLFYRANGESSWHKIGDTASTSYTWTGAKSGTKYDFTVRCISADGASYTSGYDDIGKSINYVAAPKISSVTNDAKGAKITWGKVAGAAKYRVFYKNSSGSWSKIADTTSTSYTWTGAKSSTKYTFTVRCVSSDGKTYTSSYDNTGKSLSYIAAPKISSVANDAAGVKINWGKVAGAAKYRVFYKTGNGGWKKLGDTTSTSYTWKGAKSGTKYAFTVRCVSSDGSSYTSGYDNTGKSITYIAAPKLSSVSKTSSGVQIKWGKVTGAAKYRVFYKTGSGGWKKLADTTSTSYTWTGGKKGTKYSITVRCISSDGKTYTSGYDNTGKSVTR
ncbi:MAG: fibronectin type III domain-containing protein [Eubacterium sp.]|nr:fibronectin type III domain-containing protein [Eubacterium sp.]